MSNSLKSGTSTVFEQARHNASTLFSRVQENFLPSVKQHSLLLSVILAAVLSTVIVAGLWIAKDSSNMRPLYGRQELYDSAAIMDTLDAERIPYRLHPDSGQILVPADQISSARMRLATAGISPQLPEGMELLSASGQFGRSQFVERKQYIQALQGELERTIASFRPVRFARVHLAIPERMSFQRQDGDTSASVYLDLYPSALLDSRQVQGIINLVAGSVPNLKPQRVSVLDQNSNPLYGVEPGSQDGSRQLTYRKKLEQQYVKRLSYLLEPLVGTGNLRVAVNADIDFSYKESTHEDYDPDSAVVRSESFSQTADNKGQASGIPGASTDTAENEKQRVQSGKAVNRVRNFELDRSVSFQRQKAYRLRQINVAVILNSNTPAVQDAEQKQFTDAVESLLRNAAGINMDRGDRVEVRLLPFSIRNLKEQQLAEVEFLKNNTSGLPSILMLVLGAVSLGLLLFFAWKRKQRKEQEAIEKELALLDSVSGNNGENGDANKSSDHASNRVRDLVDSNPDQVAIILERWIKESE